MRRRWLLILGGVVALGVVAVFALALLVPRAPFRFLDGHAPLLVGRRGGGGNGRAAVYSFKANYQEIVREAKVEFGKLAFDVSPMDWVDGISFWHEQKIVVIIVNATRLPEPVDMTVGAMSSFHMNAPGWVTVVVDLPAPNLWDSVKAVFGL